MDELTFAEKKAEEATKLPAFPVNLHEIRNHVEQLLSEFGRYGFFNEYTNHSFKHVKGMLESLDWIIPESAKEKLTLGDWLFLTLAIYFHDLGLLISRREFDLREKNPDYKRFVEYPPIQGIDLDEYRAKLARLSPDEQEKINYQEFVRFNHGARVRAWIEGAILDEADSSSEIRGLVASLIGKLSDPARADLAKICQSHTEDDIDDTSKYKLFKPYGQKAGESVNLQYVAIVLRTVDLLHITSDRAPAALYQFISPVDPLSQLEWQKQSAVLSVAAAVARDKEGKADASAESDTIQVYAHFRESEGFFGLTNYLSYVQTQIRASYEANRKSAHIITNPPLFPWKNVDDSNVEAEGFITKVFGFELDQQKILDLLTGHTLYNDTNVVLRELTQNALDAVRLQASIAQVDVSAYGKISISWDSGKRVLEISDNGTGMTQEVIEQHLLKVGSSRYQDPKFKEEHPDFSSISRFGIGVLSAFMVSDNVEITTCSPLDPHARTISLRSVHGKYLIKLHDKLKERAQIGVLPNGTRVRLTIRPTAKIGDVLEIARSWLLFPACQVTVKIDGQEACEIGYASPKAALEEYLKSVFDVNSRSLEVKSERVDGLELAYVIVKDELFGDWSFVQVPDSRRRGYIEDAFTPISTCVEGVAVDFATPGFNGRSIIAVANATGKLAPKTNVARSALEDTEEHRNMLRRLYELYAKHVSDEVSRLSKERDYSMSRAVQQAPFILSSLLQKGDVVARPALLDEQLEKIGMLVVESQGARRTLSVSELIETNEFWTVASPLVSSLEQFVRESPREISATSILERLQDQSYALPDGVTVCNLNYSPYIEKAVRKNFDPVEIVANSSLRRLSIKWRRIGENRRWLSANEVYRQVSRADRGFWERFYINKRESSGRPDSANINVPLENLASSGLGSSGAVQVGRDIFLSPDNSVSIFLRERSEMRDERSLRALCLYMYMVEVFHVNYKGADGMALRSSLSRIMANFGVDFAEEYMDMEAFGDAVARGNFGAFDPYAWRRRMEGAG